MSLHRIGDLEGEGVWNSVADAIERQQRNKHGAPHQEIGGSSRSR